MTTKAIQTAKPTDNYLGTCTDCREPVRARIPGSSRDRHHRACPGCRKGNVVFERVYGIHTVETCDASCMGATGPRCNCGCGGANHGRSWNVRTTYSEMTASELAARRAALDQLRAREEKTRQRREAAWNRKCAKAAAEVAAWRAGLTPDQGAAIDLLTGGTLDLANNVFLMDMYERLTGPRPQPLTPRQLKVAVSRVAQELREAERAREREAREAEEAANAKPVPTGRHTITGEIVYTETRESQYGYNRLDSKMIVKGDGWKVWMTVPRDLLVAVDYWVKNLRGRRVEVTVAIEPSDRDPAFGFAKSPKGARLLDA